MDQRISEILADLYDLDARLRLYDQELNDAIGKMIQARPDTRFNRAFEKRLRDELFEKIAAMKQSQADKSTKQYENPQKGLKQWFGVFGIFPSGLNSALLAGVILLMVGVLTFIGYGRYAEKGGDLARILNIGQDQGDAKFELVAMSPDTQAAEDKKIEPDSSFVLSSSKKLSEKKIRKMVKFEPAVDFTVTEIEEHVSWLVPTAFAAEGGREQANSRQLASNDKEETTGKDGQAGKLVYRYEIKVVEPLKEDVTYRVSIKDTSVADQEYQWEFQVKAPFSVKESKPADKSTAVAVDSKIEITFNRELPADAGEHVLVEPKVAGTFEVRGDSLVFVPEKRLEEGIVYTVTIKGGLPAAKPAGQEQEPGEGDGQRLRPRQAEEAQANNQVNDQTNDLTKELLANEHILSFETARLSGVEKTAEFSLKEELVKTTPDQRPMIDITVDTGVDSGLFTLEVYGLGTREKYDESVKAANDWPLSWTVYSKYRPLEQYKPDDSSRIFTAELAALGSETATRLLLPQSLPNGYYFFVLQNNGQQKSGWIQSLAAVDDGAAGQAGQENSDLTTGSRQEVSGSDIRLEASQGITKPGTYEFLVRMGAVGEAEVSKTDKADESGQTKSEARSDIGVKNQTGEEVQTEFKTGTQAQGQTAAEAETEKGVPIVAGQETQRADATANSKGNVPGNTSSPGTNNPSDNTQSNTPISNPGNNPGNPPGNAAGETTSNTAGDKITSNQLSGRLITARLLKVAYLKIEDGQYIDAADQSAKKRYRYVKNEVLVEEVTGYTDAQGKWTLTKELPWEEGSIYIVYLSARDATGRLLRIVMYVEPRPVMTADQVITTKPAL